MDASTGGHLGGPGRPSRLQSDRLAEDVRFARHAHLCAIWNAAGLSTRFVVRPSRSRAKSNNACRISPPASGGRKSATACSSTTTRTPRIAPWLPRTPCGRRPTRAFRRRLLGMRSASAIRRISRSRPCPRATIRSEIAHAAIDQHAGSIEGLLELFERQGLGDAPWPPHYRKQASEPPRVQPSKRKRSRPQTPTDRDRPRPPQRGCACRARALETRATRKLRRTCSRLTCWSTPCAGATAPGRGSASICSTCPRSCGPIRSRSTRTRRSSRARRAW